MSGKRSTPLDALKAAIARLPAPRDEAAKRLLVAGRDLVTGRAPAKTATKPPRKREPAHSSGPARTARPKPFDDVGDWQRPPVSDGHDVLTEVLYDTGDAPARYDIELIEQLNAEYADKPIVPAPPSYAVADRVDNALRRVGWVQNSIDLRNKTVLEIGCSNGYESWLLAHNAGADVYGIDVNRRGSWTDLEGERVHFTCADMAAANPYDENKFDAIYSFVVWEHVLHPYSLLREAYRSVKPGGTMWLRANLFCGPQASHRYRELAFPWPHLLFSEDVLRDWDVTHGRGPKGPAWVNRLTWDNYARYFDEIGWRVRSVQFQEAAWDESFYQRFEDMLGRYPKRDLKRDFFLAVLDKPLG